MGEWEVRLTGRLERGGDTVSFRFERPPDLDYLPGQYFFLHLRKGDRVLVHHFSFSSSPLDKGYIELTTRMRGSEYKKALGSLPLGAKVRIGDVHGEFTLKGVSGKVAFIAGGIGVTAAYSNIKWALQEGVKVDILLLYANRSLSSAAFLEELQSLSEAHDNLKVVHILSRPEPGWTGETGHVNSELIERVVRDWRDRAFYVSGPPAMVASVREMLLGELGLPEARVKVESFLGY